MLSATAKKIIQSRLYDKGIKVELTDLDTILIDTDNYEDNNTMYNAVVENYEKLIIG